MYRAHRLPYSLRSPPDNRLAQATPNGWILKVTRNPEDHHVEVEVTAVLGSQAHQAVRPGQAAQHVCTSTASPQRYTLSLWDQLPGLALCSISDHADT